MTGNEVPARVGRKPDPVTGGQVLLCGWQGRQRWQTCNGEVGLIVLGVAYGPQDYRQDPRDPNGWLRLRYEARRAKDPKVHHRPTRPPFSKVGGRSLEQSGAAVLALRNRYALTAPCRIECPACHRTVRLDSHLPLPLA